MNNEDLKNLSGEPVFQEHGCHFVKSSVFLKRSTIEKSSVAISKYGNNFRYLQPIPGFTNHLIWGGSYAQDEYGFCDQSIEELVEGKLNTLASRVFITSLNFGIDPIIEAEKFSFLLASKFLEWTGYIQEFLVVSPDQRMVFYRNEELEYALYCRDLSLHAQPFVDIEDNLLVEAFKNDAADFANPAIDGIRTLHLNNEIMPFTLEANQQE